MEKSRKVIRYVSCFTVLLLLLSILPATTLAGNGQGVGNDAENGKSWKVANSDGSNPEEDADTEEEADEDDSDSEPLRKKELIKQRVHDKKQLREEIQIQKREYQDAKGAFLRIRSQVRAGQLNPNSDMAMNGTRLYLNSSVCYMIAHLEGVQYNLENSNGNGTDARAAALQERINQLKEEQEYIENAEDYEDFVIVVKSVSGVWNNAQKEAALGAGQTVSERMDDFLDRSESLSDRLDDKIQKLNETGVDTTGLEDNLTLYKELIGYARDNHTAAVNIYENESATAEDLDNANDYLRTALDNVNEANEIVKDIFNELNEYEIEAEKEQEQEQLQTQEQEQEQEMSGDGEEELGEESDDEETDS
jgi:hypothetical protein